MSEQLESGAAAATQVTPAAGDQPTSGAPKVDLEAEVAKAAAKAERDARNRASLDLIDNPEHRKIAERLVSQGINDYRKKLEEGKDEEFMRKSDVERTMRDFAKSLKAEAAAVEQFRDHMADMGIKRGSDDWASFEKELGTGFYDKAKLGDRALVERIARAAQVGQFRPVREVPQGGIPFTPSTGTALKPGEGGKGHQMADDEVSAVVSMAKKARQR